MFSTPEFCRPAVQAALKIAAFALMAGVASGAAAVGSPPPANDFCDAAVTIGVPSVTAGSTHGATTEPVVNLTTCGTNINSPGVWYKFTAPSSGTVTTDTCRPARNYDTKLSAFTGSCAAPACITGNDDNCGLGSVISFEVTAGETYRILVHGFGGQTGDFDLEVTQTAINTFEENIACARDGINALMQPDITGPAQKNMLVGALNLVGLYKTTYPSLAGSILNSVIVRTDGCPLRGSPDTYLTPGAGGAGVDFVNTCPGQGPIHQCLIDARAQLMPGPI